MSYPISLGHNHSCFFCDTIYVLLNSHITALLSFYQISMNVRQEHTIAAQLPTAQTLWVLITVLAILVIKVMDSIAKVGPIAYNQQVKSHNLNS